MAGTSEGARKARETNKQKYGSDFYSTIGKKSWTNPDRSHDTGFALLTPEERADLGRKGGKKTKDDYKTTNRPAEKEDTEYYTAEEIHDLIQPQSDDAGLSE